MQEVKAKEIKIVTPEPYYNITFGYSHRNFYDVKNELHDLWDKFGIEDEFNNGYYTEKCDYEGDLEKIIIYNNPKIISFINKVIEHYGGNASDLKDMNLHLSIY